MGAWPKRHEERQTGRERLGKKRRMRGRSEVHESRRGWGGGKIAGDREKWQQTENNNEWGWRTGCVMTKEASVKKNKREETDGVSRLGDETLLLFAAFSAHPHQRPRSPYWLSSCANMSSRSRTRVDEKMDCDLVLTHLNHIFCPNIRINQIDCEWCCVIG